MPDFAQETRQGGAPHDAAAAVGVDPVEEVPPRPLELRPPPHIRAIRTPATALIGTA